jgi:hypothetical protein
MLHYQNLSEMNITLIYYFCQTIVKNWRQEYNNYRPHSSLGYLTPSEFAKRYYENKQAEEATQPVEKAGSLSL